ncbi:extracellular solute-binding protein [Paenibacillus sp. ACRSA]|uniref:ABC transporter substrate-binding protein n=1 Tax=Paenibacillus sp. ACRSA TaxID=2918211 RepID=UPI001EF6822D|nr:extracellular solute-binding protein [Paenibacillus sp. ACRSA]MCG7379213.1 extracellular solute-binding protein [Paenibacillus sp. ACRSA]
MYYIQKQKNNILAWFSIALLLSLLTGCGLFGESTKEKIEPITNKELTVLTPQSEESFYQYYGNHIMSKFPGVTFNVISSNNDSLYEDERFFEDSHADLIISYLPTFRSWRETDRIESMNPYLQNSTKEIQLDDYYDQMKEVLSNESGELLGLAPQVVVSGIFYNKDLFDSIQVDYPTDQMSWEQLLSLSNRFADGDRYGFEGGEATPQNVVMTILATNKIRLLDDQNQELIFNEKDWLKMIELAVNLQKQGSLIEGTGEHFLEGKSAMLSSNISMIPKLQQQNSFSWGVVSYPSDPLHTELSSGLQFNHVLSINKESANKEDVWKIIAYLMSEESADHLQTQDYIGSLPTLNSKLGSYSGVEINHVIQKKVDTRRGYYDDLSQGFQEKFGGMLKSVLDAGVKDEKSTEQIYKEIVSQGSNIYREEMLKDE